VEYDEFTKEFLRLYEDRDFLVEAKPILNKMRDRIVISEHNLQIHIYNEFLKSEIFVRRFSEVEPAKVRAKVSKIVKCVTEYPHNADEIKDIAISHVALKLTEQEMRDLEDVFSLVKYKGNVYRAKLRVLFDQFIDVLRQYDGLYENEACFTF